MGEAVFHIIAPVLEKSTQASQVTFLGGDAVLQTVGVDVGRCNGNTMSLVIIQLDLCYG